MRRIQVHAVFGVVALVCATAVAWQACIPITLRGRVLRHALLFRGEHLLSAP